MSPFFTVFFSWELPLPQLCFLSLASLFLLFYAYQTYLPKFATVQVSETPKRVGLFWNWKPPLLTGRHCIIWDQIRWFEIELILPEKVAVGIWSRFTSILLYCYHFCSSSNACLYLEFPSVGRCKWFSSQFQTIWILLCIIYHHHHYLWQSPPPGRYTSCFILYAEKWEKAKIPSALVSRDAKGVQPENRPPIN